MMMDLTHARTRTANRLIRSQMPCPLGHMGGVGVCFGVDGIDMCIDDRMISHDDPSYILFFCFHTILNLDRLRACCMMM